MTHHSSVVICSGATSSRPVSRDPYRLETPTLHVTRPRAVRSFAPQTEIPPAPPPKHAETSDIGLYQTWETSDDSYVLILCLLWKKPDLTPSAAVAMPRLHAMAHACALLPVPQPRASRARWPRLGPTRTRPQQKVSPRCYM